jgi:putative transposase
MPSRLKRYHHEGEDHFITVSCYHRQPYFITPQAKDIALTSLEATRQKYEVEVLGYVVMPEHVHLLIFEPPDHENHTIATVMQAWKISVARRLPQRPFWQRRYYDFNVSTRDKFIEKLRYMHRNPVTRGLVESPEDWQWSSYRHYLLEEDGPVTVSKA